MSPEYDSRKVKKDSSFVAIIGEKSDGHDYIQQAINQGAERIIADLTKKEELQALVNENKTVEFVFVEDTRDELARLSAKEAGNPSDKLKVIGITGTNGKTTVTHLVQAIFANKRPCALLGTMGLKKTVSDTYLDLGNTTPQSKEIQEIMASLVKENYDYLAMEVSSHAVDQKRTAYINFKSFAVTNLTQDHLDYHVTMENYFKAKAEALKQVSDSVVLNADDEYFGKFNEAADKSNLKVISISLHKAADYQASNIAYSNGSEITGACSSDELRENQVLMAKLYKETGLSYDLMKDGEKILRVSLKLNGTFNVYNSMFAIVLALNEGLSITELEEVLPKLEPVAGRFEVIQSASSPMCVVDYAHSPDGLENVLKGSRDLIKPGAKLVCLFGCGGDRDITKRPKMAKIAYELSDFVFVTSDNPRTEDPEQIVADILTGIPEMSKVKVIIDRRTAIQEAVKFCKKEDILVIAGKGHEDYQIIGETKIHFDDREEVRKILA